MRPTSLLRRPRAASSDCWWWRPRRRVGLRGRAHKTEWPRFRSGQTRGGKRRARAPNPTYSLVAQSNSLHRGRVGSARSHSRSCRSTSYERVGETFAANLEVGAGDHDRDSTRGRTWARSLIVPALRRWALATDVLGESPKASADHSMVAQWLVRLNGEVISLGLRLQSPPLASNPL